MIRHRHKEKSIALSSGQLGLDNIPLPYIIDAHTVNIASIYLRSPKELTRRKNKATQRSVSPGSQGQNKSYSESVEYLHKPHTNAEATDGAKSKSIPLATVNKVKSAINRGSSKSALDTAKSIHKQHKNAESDEVVPMRWTESPLN